jgi:hypothetical protein
MQVASNPNIAINMRFSQREKRILRDNLYDRSYLRNFI